MVIRHRIIDGIRTADEDAEEIEDFDIEFSLKLHFTEKSFFTAKSQ